MYVDDPSDPNLQGAAQIHKAILIASGRVYDDRIKLRQPSGKDTVVYIDEATATRLREVHNKRVPFTGIERESGRSCYGMFNLHTAGWMGFVQPNEPTQPALN